MTRSTLLVLALAAATARAQAPVARDSARLDPVVVTAARTAEPAASASASVTVLRGDDLRARGVTSVADALREVPGLAVVASGPQGGATSVFARGGNSNFVKVLIDGVAVNEAGGAFDFAGLRLTNVDRIEVVRGPVSVLYGSDAVAGVVQIFTRGARAASVMVEGRAGSRETAEARAEVSGGGGARWSSGGSHLRTRGLYPFNNHYRADDASALIATTATAPVDARLTARYLGSRYRFPTTGSGVPTDSNAFTGERRLVIGGEVGRRLSPALEARASAGWNRLRRISDNAPDSPGDTSGFYSRSESESSRRMVDARLIASAAAGSLTAGLERTWQRETSDGSSRFASFPPSLTRFDEHRANTAGFAQAAVTPGGAIRATLGGRVDENDRFGRFATWRAAFAWSPVAAFTGRASAGTAFREPAFAETFSTAFTTGNPALDPERTRSREVGAALRPADWARMGIVFFDQKFDNLIQYVGRPFGSPLPNYENLAAATARGAEVETEVSRSAFHAGMNLTLLRTRVRESGTGAGGTFVRGEQLLRRPSRSASATLGYRARHAVSLTLFHTGRRSDRDFGVFPARAVTLDPFTLLDAAGSVALRAIDLTLRVENAGNVRYENVYGFRTPGRTLLVGGRFEK